MDPHREHAAGYHEPHKPEVGNALLGLFNGASGYPAGERSRHIADPSQPVVPGRETSEREPRAVSGGEVLAAPSGLDTSPFSLEPLEEHPHFTDIYEQFAPDEAEIALDAQIRDLRQRLDYDVSIDEQSDLASRLAGSKKRFDHLRGERLRHLGDAIMPLLEVRQAQLATVSADLADYRPRPEAEQPPTSGTQWEPAEVKLADIACASTFIHWGGKTISGQTKNRHDGREADPELLVREMARDIALGVEVKDDPDVYLVARTAHDGRRIYVTQAGEYRVAALKLLGRTEVEAEVRGND